MVARVVQAECHASGTFERQQAQGRRRPPCVVFWRCTAYSTVQRCKPCSSRVLFCRTRSGPCCVLQWQVNLFCTLPGSLVDPIRSLIVLPLVWFVITVRGVCLWRSSRGPLQYRTVQYTHRRVCSMVRFLFIACTLSALRASCCLGKAFRCWCWVAAATSAPCSAAAVLPRQPRDFNESDNKL